MTYTRSASRTTAVTVVPSAADFSTAARHNCARRWSTLLAAVILYAAAWVVGGLL